MTDDRVEVARIGGAPLVDRVLAGDPTVLALYGGDPALLASYRDKLEEVSRRFDRAARERAAAALRPVTEQARRRLARFVEEGGAMVTTGQQAGLFTGPMYTISKALTAVALAEALERRLGVVVLPVFWVASEDHDFAEVDHAWSVDEAGTLARSGVRRTTAVPVPMADMRLGADVDTAVGDFVQRVTPEQDAADRLTEYLGGYRPGETMASAFTRTLERLFAGLDLCLTDAADPAVKEASASVLAGEAAAAVDHERRLAERAGLMRSHGLTPPVTLVPDSTNLFFHGPAGRERLHRTEVGFLASDAGVQFTAAELQRAITQDPGRFSPNVLLRPVVESAVFPTLAYVGGPAETGYFAQIGPLFESFGIRAPVAFPRFGARVVPAQVTATAAELRLDPAEARHPEHEVLEAVARAHLPAPVTAALDALRAEVVARFGELIDAADGIAPTLPLALGARRDRAMLEVAAAERKIIRQLKRSDATLAKGVRLVRNHLWPNGAPQERVLTVFQYLLTRDDLLGEIRRGIRIQLR